MTYAAKARLFLTLKNNAKILEVPGFQFTPYEPEGAMIHMYSLQHDQPKDIIIRLKVPDVLTNDVRCPFSSFSFFFLIYLNIQVDISKYLDIEFHAETAAKPTIIQQGVEKKHLDNDEISNLRLKLVDIVSK